MPEKTTEIKYNDETILDLIRSARNDLIKTLLTGSNLMEYLQGRYTITGSSNVRIEFMKRTLQELLIAPVDLEHYGRLILEIRKSEDPASLLKHHESLFVSNIETALKNYLY